MNFVSVSNVSKSYRSYTSEWKRIVNWLGFSSKAESENWVLRNISFSMATGEVIGIIGKNGAGKSSLLKLITGTSLPTEGSIDIKGRISAVLELGMGFNPEFTGRRNAIHGLGLMGFNHEQIELVMPELEAFAEIGEYFDMPLRTYSSGMQMRVAFAVATAFRPEILIIDEALSVGDSYFQHKSFDRILQFKEQGTLLLFVTHGMGDIRTLCDRVILLDKGEIIKDGLPDEVVDYYNALIAEQENSKLTVEQRRKKDGWLHSEYGTKEAIVESIQLLDADSRGSVSLASVGQNLIIETKVKLSENLPKIVLGHRITDRSGHLVWGTNTWHTKQTLENVPSGSLITFRVSFNCRLGPGSYAISFGLVSSDTHLDDCYHRSESPVVFDVINVDKPLFGGTNWLDPIVEIELQKGAL